MEETKKLSSLSEIKLAISQKRDEFYRLPENKATDVNGAFSVASKFIYGEHGLKSIPCNYNIAKFALAEMIRDSARANNTDWNAGMMGVECFVFLRTAISGVKIGENKYLNEDNDYVLETILSETGLKNEMTDYVILDGIKKFEHRENIKKTALSGWLGKVVYLLKNDKLPEKKRAAIALNAKLISDYVGWRGVKKEEIPSVFDSLKTLTDSDEKTDPIASMRYDGPVTNEISVSDENKIHENPGYSESKKIDNMRRTRQRIAESELPIVEDIEPLELEDLEETVENSDDTHDIISDTDENDYEPDFFKARSQDVFNYTADDDALLEEDSEDEDEIVDFFDNDYLMYENPVRNDISTILNTITSSSKNVESFDSLNSEVDNIQKDKDKLAAQKACNKMWKTAENIEKKNIISISKKNAKNLSKVIENFAYGDSDEISSVENDNLYQIVKEVQDSITTSFNTISD